MVGCGCICRFNCMCSGVQHIHNTYTLVPCAAMLPQITYQEALAAVFIEGWIFIFISLTGEPLVSGWVG